MRYVSLFSGIEAASVAWHPLGWTPVAFAEIEPFPSAVLAHHYPDVPNLGDVTKVDWHEFARANGPIDLVVFGSPCQSFSVAGKRLGLDDPRGNLAIFALGIINILRPQWFIFENVPGLLSSGEGRDFGAFLGTISELGDYGAAWKILDAQFVRVESHPRAVPQRRRRVFVVGNLGSWQRAAAVLFERESLSGHPPPSRKTGERLADSLTVGANQYSGFCGEPVEWPASVAPTMGTGWGDRHPGSQMQDMVSQKGGMFVPELIAFGGNDTRGPIDVATARNGHGGPCGRLDFESETFVTEVAGTMKAIAESGGWSNSADHAAAGYMVPVAFDMRGREGGSQFEGPHDTANIRAASGGSSKSYVAFQTQGGDMGVLDDVMGTLRGNSDRASGSAPMLAISGEAFNDSGDKQGIDRHASPSEAHARTLLLRVREALGEEAFAQWGLGIFNSLQRPEVLQSALHGIEFRPTTFTRSWVVYCALSRPEDRSKGALCSLREAGGEGHSPSGPGLSEQYARELGAYLSELSQPGAQPERFMLDLWRASEGLGLLREALSALQAPRQSSGHKGQSAHGSFAVRRLSPEECEFLQAFPRGYTAVPYRGKIAADGPRYKALGNSMAVNCMRWLGDRIESVHSMQKALAA